MRDDEVPGIRPIQGVAAQALDLERLKVMMQLNPHGPFGDDVSIAPPAMLPPKVIELVAHNYNRIETLEAKVAFLWEQVQLLRAALVHPSTTGESNPSHAGE